MKTKIKFCFGVVQSFSPEKGFGRVKISEEPMHPTFSLDTQRLLVEGVSVPEFSAFTPTHPFIPHKGGEVACILEVDYELEVTTACRTLRRTANVVEWDYRQHYREIEEAIAARPLYEVVEFVFYNGKPTSSVNQRQIINCGRAERLQTQYPRGVARDPLAPEGKVMDLTYRRRFYRRTPDGRKIQCPDPRPLPEGMAAEPFQPTNEQGELLASADEVIRLANAFSSRKREAHELVTG